MKPMLKQNKKSKKPLLILSLVLVLLLTGTAIFVVQARQNNKKESGTERTSATEMEEGADKKEELLNNQTGTQHVDPTKTTDEVATSSAFTVTLNELTYSDGLVKYAAKINSATNGLCSAMFTNELGKPVHRETNTTSGNCSGTIPAVEFDAIGTWQLELTFYANNAKATVTGTVEVR